MRTFRIAEGDLVVVRLAHERVPDWWVENLAKMFKIANPKWCGAMIVLDVDQEIGTLPERKARELYKRLKSQFEPKQPKRGKRR